MSAPVTFVRSEDLLDETPPEHLARSYRLSRRRQLTGLALAAVMLPVVTLLMGVLDSELALDAQVLIYLLAVVVISFVGGILVAVGSAVASSLLINFFFVDPVHTLTVGDPDQVITLVVFVAVAALVSGAVELAVRRARTAERALAEAKTMSALAGSDLESEGSLKDILRQARETFGMESVALLARQRGTGEWLDVEHAGWAPPGNEQSLRFDVPAGLHIRLIGRGPALFAEDQRVLEAFAAAARTSYEGRVLSGEAQQARELATVDRQRTSLLAAVGHDLRTPLAAVKAAVSSLRQTDIEWSGQERDELLETIEDSSDQLDSVVENLLDASRLEAGALSVRPGAVALGEVVASTLLSLPVSEGQVSVDVSEELPLVSADRGLLQRALANVIDNAIRHGGGSQPVEVRAQAAAESARIEIVDHGKGVNEVERARLFEPFQRLDDRDSSGIGLGLSVARGFIEAMGGAMVADATSGGGLTMRIKVPLAQAGKAESAK